MVTTTFIGRLGNSMFQTAAAIGYAKKYGYEWGVPNDQKESTILTHFPHLPRCDNRYPRYNEHINGRDNDWFNYREIPDHGGNTNLFGFFQSWKYFEHCKEEIREVFKLPHVSGYEDYVSIHVRRGDYVQHAGSFPPITVDYINAALRVIETRQGKNWPKCIFFSDDIQWCKDNFSLAGPMEFDDLPTGQGYELQKLSKMASCHDHIIANSSFSWWGAYLGHNRSRIVIAPSCKRGNWFGLESGVKQDCIDLLPPEWTQMEFR